MATEHQLKALSERRLMQSSANSQAYSQIVRGTGGFELIEEPKPLLLDRHVGLGNSSLLDRGRSLYALGLRSTVSHRRSPSVVKSDVQHSKMLVAKACVALGPSGKTLDEGHFGTKAA